MSIAVRIIETLGLANGTHDEAFGHRLDTLTLTTPDRRQAACPSVFARRASA